MARTGWNEVQEVLFTSITWFTGMDAVQGFAGDDYEQAVVEETARQALSRGQTCPPGEDDLAAAATEGWIAIPDSPIGQLI